MAVSNDRCDWHWLGAEVRSVESLVSTSYSAAKMILAALPVQNDSTAPSTFRDVPAEILVSSIGTRLRIGSNVNYELRLAGSSILLPRLIHY
jgi:hypothetical protein